MFAPRDQGPRVKKLVSLIRFYFNIHGKMSVIRFYNDFSVWLKTGSNPADINWFRSHTENLIF